MASDPAKDDGSRSAAHDELDAILREADVARRRSGGAGSPTPPLELHPRLPDADNRPPAKTVPPRTSDAVRFERYDVRVDDPGDLKIRTFRFSGKLAVVLGLGLVAAYVWLAAPRGFDFLHPQPLPSSYTEASVRWAMVLTASRVDRFYADHRRLPEGLGELGPAPTELITYERLSDVSYRLQAPGENAPLVLTPSASRELFLGGSLDVLRLGPDRAP